MIGSRENKKGVNIDGSTLKRASICVKKNKTKNYYIFLTKNIILYIIILEIKL